jgi:hypothetical protein
MKATIGKNGLKINRHDFIIYKANSVLFVTSESYRSNSITLVSLSYLSSSQINSLCGSHYLQTLQGRFWGITVDNALIKRHNKIEPCSTVYSMQPKFYYGARQKVTRLRTALALLQPSKFHVHERCCYESWRFIAANKMLATGSYSQSILSCRQSVSFLKIHFNIILPEIFFIHLQIKHSN